MWIRDEMDKPKAEHVGPAPKITGPSVASAEMGMATRESVLRPLGYLFEKCGRTLADFEAWAAARFSVDEFHSWTVGGFGSQSLFYARAGAEPELIGKAAYAWSTFFVKDERKVPESVTKVDFIAQGDDSIVGLGNMGIDLEKDVVGPARVAQAEAVLRVVDGEHANRESKGVGGGEHSGEGVLRRQRMDLTF